MPKPDIAMHMKSDGTFVVALSNLAINDREIALAMAEKLLALVSEVSIEKRGDFREREIGKRRARESRAALSK